MGVSFIIELAIGSHVFYSKVFSFPITLGKLLLSFAKITNNQNCFLLKIPLKLKLAGFQNRE